MLHLFSGGMAVLEAGQPARLLPRRGAWRDQVGVVDAVRRRRQHQAERYAQHRPEPQKHFRHPTGPLVSVTGMQRYTFRSP